MDEYLNKVLSEAEAEAKKKVEAGLDKGHNRLVWELEHVLEEARKYEFHDFLNTKYDAPKMVLVAALDTLKEHAINGEYDN